MFTLTLLLLLSNYMDMIDLVVFLNATYYNYYIC